MITLALAQMVYFFCLQAPFTGGEDGIQAVPRGTLFGVIRPANRHAMYYVRARRLRRRLPAHLPHHPFALRPGAQGDPRERAARHLARLRAPTATSSLVFVLSAALAGLAGATKAIVFQLASLTDVHWTMSGEVVLMTLLGGIGTVFGPVVGALVIVVSMENYLARVRRLGDGDRRASSSWSACSLFRRGIVGVLSAWLKRPL